MQVTKEEVEKIAELARLQFSEKEKEKLRKQLDQILTYINKLNELDTKNVTPTYYVQYSGNVMREDRVNESLPRYKLLKNTPATMEGFVCVPKVIYKS